MSWQTLLALGAEHHGYFTASEAAHQGLSWRALSGRVERGNIHRTERGLYRLPHWPAESNDQLYADRWTRPANGAAGRGRARCDGCCRARLARSRLAS